MKVFIHGFYGAGNAGDDAILHSIIERLKEIHQHLDVVITIRSEKIPAYYGSEKIQGILGTDITKIADTLKQCDLLIVGGGGLFQDYNEFKPENMFINQRGAINYYTFPIILAKMLNIKTMLYAVGIGPLQLPESRTAMKWIADIVDTITVRDTASFALLHSLGISKHILSADPVISLVSEGTILPKSLKKKNTSELNIGLNLRNWTYAADDLKKAQDKLINLLNDLSKRYHVNFFIMPFNKLPSEIVKANELAKALNGNVTILKYDTSPQEYKFICKHLDLMIAMRLHASIFSIYEGVPSIGISYDGKVSQFYQELKLNQYCHNLSDKNFQSLKNIIEDCLKRPSYHKQIVEKQAKILLEREENNKLALKKICELNANE